MDKWTKSIIITGASRGLGLAIASNVLEDGFRAILIARTRTIGVDTLLDRYPTAARFLSFDLHKIDGIAAFVHDELKHEHQIYGLINNAAIGTDGVLATMHNSQIMATFALNCIAPIILTKYVIRLMLTKGEGRIINITSIIASTGYSGLSVYAATKSALLGHSRSLAREVGRAGITVNCVAPGFMKTDMTNQLSNETLERILRRSPLKSLATVDEVATAATFLLQYSSKNITGACITVDGGSSA